MPTKALGKGPRAQGGDSHEAGKTGSEDAAREKGGRAAPAADAVRALPRVDRGTAEGEAVRRAHPDNLACAHRPDRPGSASTYRADHRRGNRGARRPRTDRVKQPDPQPRSLEVADRGGSRRGDRDGDNWILPGTLRAPRPQGELGDQAGPRRLSDDPVHRARPAL